MIVSPFPHLATYSRATICLLTREDDVRTDADIARITGARSLVGLKQVHGNRAIIAREASSRLHEADAVFTDVVGLTLSIRFADCQNAVLIAPDHGVIGLVHAGWRGVQRQVMTEACRELHETWGIQPAEVLIGLGPSLCMTCSDFTDPEREVPELASYIRGSCIDLRTALDKELLRIGALSANIVRIQDCTRCNPETYFTYRGGDRERVKNGSVNCMTVSLG